MAVEPAHRLAPFASVDRFGAVVNPAAFTPLPDGWVIGLSDVEGSTEAVADGRYKDVNMAGAAAIAAVMNALHTRHFPFAFGGDGCAFVLPGADRAAAADALARTARFCRDALNLSLRVALVAVDAVRAEGADVRVALFQPSPHVAYAMFDGGGVSAAEAAMKAGAHRIAPAPPGEAPDLEGLSCRWLPMRARSGVIVSLIVKPGPQGEAAYRAALGPIVALLDEGAQHPVPPKGPRPAFRSPGERLEALTGPAAVPLWRRRLAVARHNLLGWALFRLGLTVGGFDPVRYRRATHDNADTRKFGDALGVTADLSPALRAELVAALEAAERAGTVTFGLHEQSAAIMTCLVPSYVDDGHFHFVDGAEGGYTLAATDWRRKHAPR